MFSKEFSRIDLQETLGAKGKELTEKIRDIKRSGKLIQRRKFVEPAKSNKKVTVYQFVATNMSLGLQ